MHATRKAAPVRTTSASDAFLFPRGWNDAAEAEKAQKEEELSQARAHMLGKCFMCTALPAHAPPSRPSAGAA
jgi:hypothetical protein